MARLPTTIGLNAPNGTRPSMATLSPTDLGLGAVADNLTRYGAAKQKVDDQIDDEEAQRILDQARQDYEPGLQQRAEAYDGSEPGYAKAELGQLETYFKPVIDGEARTGVRNALARRLDGYRARVGDHALNVESAKRAEPIRQQRQATETLELSRGVTSYLGLMADRQKARREDDDGSFSGWSDKALADHDEVTAAILADTPEDRRPALEAKLAAMRVSAYANAREVEDKGQMAYVAQTAKASLNEALNAVLTDPSLHDGALKALPEIAAALPGDLREGFEREAAGKLAQARLEGFLIDDDTATAKAELNSGKFDKVLDAGVKENLLAKIEAQANRGPRSLDDWRRIYSLNDRMDAEFEAIATTGKPTGAVSLDEISQLLGAKGQAEYEAKTGAAYRIFNATGDVRDLDNAALRARASAPPPDPSQPNYAEARQAWELGQKAAAAELGERDKDPAAWALRSVRPNDHGAAMQDVMEAWLGAETAADRIKGGDRYAKDTLGVQYRVGVPAAARRVLPKEQASRLAASYANAAPEQRDAALAQIAATVMSLPTVLTTPDGGVAAPRYMALRELQAAGVGPASISAIADLADEPGRMSQFVQAVNNPASRQKLPGKGDETALENAVTARLRPFVESAGALPSSAVLNAARRERVMLTARHLVTAEGLSPKDAATRAAADLTDNYRFVDGMRIPVAVADKKIGGRAGHVAIRDGSARVILDLIGPRGVLNAVPDMLAPLPGAGGAPLSPEHGRQKAAEAVREHGRWVTREDDGGMILMLPTPTRGWQPVQDKHGRPISLTWAQFEARARNTGQAAPGAPAWYAPPSGQAGPKAPPAKASSALERAIEHHESRGQVGAVSPAGALGVMQLMPATAQAAARRLGVAYDEKRLTSDADYNRRLGREELRHLGLKYDGHPALMAAAYNAGPGAVDKWIRQFGDPRRGVSADEWVAKIPYRETRQYVANVLPTALGFLK